MRKSDPIVIALKNIFFLCLFIVIADTAVAASSYESEGDSGPVPGQPYAQSLDTRNLALGPQAFDTIAYDFSSSLEGWNFFLGVDTVQEYYRDALCIERSRMRPVGTPFSLSWSSFGGTGAAMTNCAFDGYYTGSCDYRWQIKSIQTSVPTTWNGASRIEARIYKSVSSTVYAMIGYRRPGDATFSYVGWQGALPTGSWTTISLQEPNPGDFSNLLAVSVLFGSYSATGPVYVDWVRRIKFVAVTPTLNSPADQATIEDNLPNFSWSGDGATYTLQIDGDTTFASPITYDGIVGTSFEVPQPFPNSGGYANIQYYWRVRANYAGGIASGFSAPYRLYITGPHDVPSEFPTINAAYTAFGLRSAGTVRVAPGTYTGAANCNIGSFGERLVSIISSGGALATIIDCQGLYPGFSYDLYAPGGITLQGLTIRNAKGGNGAAVTCWTGSPTIRNCIIENSSGWGIYCRSGTQARIENCQILDNDSSGVLLEYGANITVTGCQFDGNNGFGIRLGSGTAAAISDCDFTTSVTSSRGENAAIRSLEAQLSIRNCSFTNSNGNGIESYRNDLSIYGCDFVGNRSLTNGGAIAIYWSEENTVSIDSCFFRNNSAANGGGFYLAQVGTLSISHSTFVENKSGIYCNVEGTLIGPVTLSNSIIASSSPGPGIDDASGLIPLTVNCTDIYGNSGGDWTGKLAGQLGVHGNIASDPLFCDQPLGIYSLAATSPCAPAQTTCGGIGFYGVGCTLNQPPELVMIPDTTIAEAQPLAISVTASDPDGTIPSLSALSLPANSSFSDHHNGGGTFAFTPAYDQAGSYNVVFIASDQESADTATFKITVLNVNRAPLFSSADDDSVHEGGELLLVVTAVDPDGPPPSLSAQNLPENGTFADHGNGSGTFAFHPDFGQSGQYSVRFIASDGELSDTADVSILVTGTNRPPVFEPIGDQDIAELQQLSLMVKATDPDETVPTLSALRLPIGASFSDQGDGIGLFAWTPSYEQSGVHAASFQASDGSLTASMTVSITVSDVNRRPVWSQATDTSIRVDETLVHEVRASDPDGESIALSARGLPLNAVLSDDGNGSGTLVFSPELNQVGEYSIILVASDGNLADTAEIVIAVLPGALLSVRPDTIRLPIDAGVSTFIVSNEGQAELDWFGVVDVPWLAVHPNSGLLPAGEELTIEVVTDMSGLASGYHWGHVDLESNGGVYRVTLLAGKSLAVTAPPLLTSVHINETIEVPFNGLINPPNLLSSVVVTTSSGSECEMGISVTNNRTALTVSPLTGEEFHELDSVVIHIDPDLQTDDGVPLRALDTLRIYMTGAAVWPGDTDHNGRVDERDILPIGLYFGLQGPPREDAQLNWNRHLARPVLGESAWEPYATVYVDADGSGLIDANDVCGVAENWMKESEILGKTGSTRRIADQVSESDIENWKLMLTALKDCPDSQGRTELIQVIAALLSGADPVLPDAVVLHQNHPNPFNPETIIEFDLPDFDVVSLTLFNMKGQKVRELFQGLHQAGRVQINWDGRDEAGRAVASGVYFYRLSTSRGIQVKAMVLVR